MRADALRTFRELKLDEVRPIDRFTQGGPELRLKGADAVVAPTLARVYAVADMAAREPLVAPARARCERTVLSVAGDRAHDELGIARLEHIPSEAEAVHDAWPVALDEHCGALCQAKEHLEACL